MEEPELRDQRRRRAARAAWKALSGSGKEQLLREIIETRSVELRKAYPAIREIGLGYATTWVRPGGRGAARTARKPVQRLMRSPHLIFVVRNKIPSTVKVAPLVKKRLIPKELLAYATHRGARVLCAVPTDVKDQGEHRFTLQGLKPTVRARAPGGTTRGTACCVVQDPIEPNRLHLLGCHHVFCLSENLPGPPPERRVELLQSGHVFGPSPFHGIIKGGRRFSLDAALLDYEAAIGLHGPPYLPKADLIAQHLGEVPDSLLIRTPRPNADGGRVRARFIEAFPQSTLIQDYHRSYGRPIIHEELIKLQITSAQGTEPGDSGSPIFDAQMNRLIGMHIAGQKTTPPRRLVSGEFTLMIPTYVLLRARHYGMAVPPEILLHLHT